MKDHYTISRLPDNIFRLHFDYRYSCSLIIEQLDMLYKNSKIDMVEYVLKKNKILTFLNGNEDENLTIKDLIQLRKNEPTLKIKDYKFFFHQIAIGSFIQTNIYSGYLSKKVIIENIFYFQIDFKCFVKLTEITKIGY